MKLIKLLILISLVIGVGPAETTAQKDSKWADIDKSPFDMAYYPAKAAWRNYLTGDDRNIRPKMRISYSRPSMKGRTIFGDLVPYGTEWRMGANEATELTLYQSVELGGKTIPAGNYTLSAVPSEKYWLIHVSTQRNIWGSEKRDTEQTIVSVKVSAEPLEEATEHLSMAFQRIDEESANLVIEWEKTRVRLPFSMNPILYEDIDVSPMDQVHYPATSAYQNYLSNEEMKTAEPKIKVIYSRPQKKGRKVFGELLEYGKVWRVGANESTEVTFYSNVKINGQALRRGKYNLYAVVNEDSWEFIFNTDRPAWGAANRDESKDVLKVNAKVEMDKEDLEVLNIIFEKKTESSVDMVVAWEKHRARIPISF